MMHSEIDTTAVAKEAPVLASTSEINDPIDLAVAGLDQLHTLTGLPWWATVMVGTVTLRVSLFPFTYYQAYASRRLLKAQPDIKKLSESYATAIHGQTDAKIRFGQARLYFQGLRAAWRKNRCHPLQTFVPVLVQIPCFITFVLAWRHLIREDKSLQEGGMLWFTDLSIADTTYVLPAIGLGLAYSSLQIASSRQGGGSDNDDGTPKKAPTGFGPWLLDSVSIMLLGAFPMIATLPQGVFMYWMTSSAWGIGQGEALRSPRIREFLRFPPMGAPPSSKSTAPPQRSS